MYNLGLEKAEEPEIKLSTFLGTQREQGSSRKTSTSVSLTMLKPLCRSQQTGEKLLRRSEYQTTSEDHHPSSENPVCGSRSNSWNQTGNNGLVPCWETGRQGCMLSPAYLTWCRVRHAKRWARWLTSWNQDCWKKYQQPQIFRWYHPDGRKQRGTKESGDEGERGEWESWLRT